MGTKKKKLDKLLSRRDVIAGIAATSVVLGGGLKLTGEPWEMGEGFVTTPIDIRKDALTFALMLDMIVRRANRALPYGTVYQIRRSVPRDYGRIEDWCWYASSGMQSKTGPRKAGFDPQMGCYLVGQLVATG